jgi:hypothetical protein
MRQIEPTDLVIAPAHIVHDMARVSAPTDDRDGLTRGE